MANDGSSSRSAADRGVRTLPPRKTACDCWDDVGAAWISRRPHALWREYTDRLQIALVDRWFDGPECRARNSQPSVLKTDLFDEVAGKGVVHHLVARGFRVTGIDISPVVVKAAGDRNPDLSAVVADVRELPFDDGSFDLVFSGSTLDHFETADDIGGGMAEIARVLRPSGTLVLTLDNLRNPIVWIRNGPLISLVRRCGIVPYPVGVTLGPDALAAVVRGSGLDVTRVSAMLHCPRVLAVWMAGLIEGSRPSTQNWFLEALSQWERLDRWPTRWVTGYFTAILASKRDASGITAPGAPRP